MKRLLQPATLFAALVLYLFRDVFFRGFVLGGHHDRFDNVLPLFTALNRSFRAGEILQWNPYIFCGKPAMSSAPYLIFHPLYWPVFALPESLLARTTTFVLIVHVALALGTSFLFFRKLGADRYWATLATLSYVLSSAMTWQMATEMNFATFAYLPLLLWLVLRQREDALFPNAVAQASVYALLLLCGSTQPILYAVALALIYTVWTTFEDTGLAWRAVPRLGASAAAFATGIAVAAARWFPFVQLSRAEAGTPTTYDEFVWASHTEWGEYIRVLMPELLGAGHYERYYGWINHFESFCCYAGLLAALLALRAFFRRQTPATSFWCISILVILLTVVGTPVTQLHWILTGRALLHFTRVAWLLPLCFAALVAVTGKSFFEGVERRRLAYVGAFLLAGLVATHFVASDYLGGNAILLKPEIRYSVLHFSSFLLVLLLLMELARRKGEADATFRALLLAAVTADLLVVFHIESNLSNPFAVPASAYAPPALETRVAGEPPLRGRLFRAYRHPYIRGRHLPYYQFTLNDKWIPLGVYSSSGYDNSVPRPIVELYTKFTPLPRTFERVLVPADDRVGQLTSTAVVLHEDRVHPIPNPIPRVRLYRRFRVAEGVEAVKLLRDAAWDPLRSLVLDRDPGIPSVDEDAHGQVRLTRDGANTVEVDVETDADALLLLNDTFHESWSGTLDGKPAAILRANHAFRAVVVPRGAHRVTMTYRQKALREGILVSIGATGLLLVCGAAAFARRRRA